VNRRDSFARPFLVIGKAGEALEKAGSAIQGLGIVAIASLEKTLSNPSAPTAVTT
jgi:hypothetical protein